MPNLWKSLLFYSLENKNKEVYSHVIMTIDKISEGGIYDQSGGWGAMGAGADIPILRKMIAERRATKKGTAQAAMQRGIREAEAAKQKAAAQAAAAQQVRQNIQTYGNRDRPNTGINRPGGGRGQSPTGGDVAGTPFARGGVSNLLYGGIV